MAQHFDAVDVRHFNVGDNYIVERGLNLSLSHFSRGDGFYLVTLAAQGNIEHFADGPLIVADEDIRHARPPLSNPPATSRNPALPAASLLLPRPSAFARQRCTPGPLLTAPTLCLRAPARFGKQSPGPDRYP